MLNKVKITNSNSNIKQRNLSNTLANNNVRHNNSNTNINNHYNKSHPKILKITFNKA